MEYRHLFRNVEKTVSAMDVEGSAEELVIHAARELLRNFKEELHLSGFRIYRRDNGVFRIVSTQGSANKAPEGFSVPSSYPPIEQALDSGIVLMDRSTPGVDSSIEKQLGVHQFASISVGDGQFLISFSFRGKVDREVIYYTLNIVRHAINHKLQEEAYHALVNEARKIQESILPKKHPRFPGFDIFGVSQPAESVGGDYFDYISIGDTTLGLSIGDATGHGLPSALLIRDVYVGLRMGIAREFKITKTMEKLNRIIARGKMTSRFVSLFFGELESNGLMIYVNAGHNTPYLHHQGSWTCLSERGLILGPIPEATYNRGLAHLDEGDILVLYTDGIVEATAPDGRMFEEFRLLETVEKNRDRSAKTIATAVFREVDDFLEGAKIQDDRTILILKRLSKGVASQD
ncbi:MAG TPA: PP2C family protein-serine/threonine phosphatase [Thermoanaerobaculia bacterium]|nr:PP2C family protein-serine/threonine phosphatase [Thermoanaerobaculia bacterium]HXK67192.1 PP2C family protein-serine/threonine phosphatase [Thermoanaerobaculia bacterium]